ncbi:DUF4190 domain-containing protein [Nocardia sp. 348MFTsu5.1]|uniref:DUF4190 domain-containing protein n=1 Tax=Nocardia sp. 348MFTsu5.1 TaxID=1172185 RepID=UPI00037D582D|nr:DUF4190 domain-containing protein [Nocardia sp. 348MFTsu5.1]
MTQNDHNITQGINVSPQHPITPAPQPYYQQPAPINPEKNGLGIAAIICALIGLLFCLVPFTGFIGLALGITALILGLAGWSRVRKNKATNKKTAISAVVLAILAIAGGIWGIVIVFGAVNDIDEGFDCLDQAQTSAEIDAC